MHGLNWNFILDRPGTRDNHILFKLRMFVEILKDHGPGRYKISGERSVTWGYFQLSINDPVMVDDIHDSIVPKKLTGIPSHQSRLQADLTKHAKP